MSEAARSTSVDEGEVAQFAALGDDWWDTSGPMAPLHRLNPVRVAWIRDQVCSCLDRDPKAHQPLAGIRALDVGCGGGILCEPLARLGAQMTGIEPDAAIIAVAERHARRAGHEIDYRATTAEALADAGETFDLVVAMEVVEHVADPDAFLGACAGLVRPGGLLVMSTLSRTIRAYLTAIVGAEYVLGWLPPGTHQWSRFLKPSEVARALRRAGLRVTATTGVVYDPLTNSFRTGRDTSVNYMMAAVRDHD